MAVFTHDCPHCQTKKVAFTSVFGAVIPGTDNNQWNLFATCGKCGVGVVAVYYASQAHDPHTYLQNQPGNYQLKAIHPAQDRHEAPEYLPENVESFYLQAVENRKNNYDAAGGMYRKSLDVGMKMKFPKDKFPKIKGTLFKRIKAAAELGEITAELGKWAQHIRLEGNDAAHDEAPYTEKEVAALHRFTELILMYLFTLPGMLADAQEDTEEDEENGEDAESPGNE